jgi:hypothetical protein
VYGAPLCAVLVLLLWQQCSLLVHSVCNDIAKQLVTFDTYLLDTRLMLPGTTKLKHGTQGV